MIKNESIKSIKRKELKWNTIGFLGKKQNPKVASSLKLKETKRTRMKYKVNQVGHAAE